MGANEDHPRVKMARWLRAAMDRNDITQRGLAEHCKVSKSMVTKWLDPMNRASIRAHELCSMPRGLTIEILARIGAEMGIAVAPESRRTERLDHQAHLYRLLKELADVGTTYSLVQTTHGGEITNEELSDLEREIREAQDELSKLMDWIQRQKSKRSLA